MINLVIDTNVVISAALSPTGIPAKIVSLISSSDKIQLFYSVGIYNEYKKVLAYEKLKISMDVQNIILKTLKEFGILVAPLASVMPMPDESDRIFYDTAKLANAILVTGNLKHYPKEDFILSPSEFMQGIEVYDVI